MSELYKNTYKVNSSRYQHYDYSSEGFYFVTWCVKDMKCVLSNIIDDEVVLTEVGEIVEKEIKKTEEVRTNILIDSFVVMPNHVHVIIHIGPYDDVLPMNTERNMSDRRDASVMRLDQQKQEDALPKRLYRSTLGDIIKQIKIVSTKQIRANHGSSFQWQPRVYDHIIRNDEDLKNHREYIGMNPIKWPQDKYYQK